MAVNTVPATCIDLLDLLSEVTELRFACRTNGGEYAGPCPFCGGTDRFRVWPAGDRPRYWCRQCNRHGDAIQFLREYHRLSFHEARDLVAGGSSTIRFPAARTPLGRDLLHRSAAWARPPGGGSGPVQEVPTAGVPGKGQGSQRPGRVSVVDLARWKARARTVIACAERCLWSERGSLALRHLQEERGLQPDTIRRWRLGYVPWNVQERGTLWGFPAEETITVPAGILLPCLVDEVCWSLKVRRTVQPANPKYLQVRGSRAALFGSDTLRLDGMPHRTVFLTEGEFDAILLHQEIGDLAGVATVGGAATGLDTDWLWRLRDARRIIAAYDLDRAGANGAAMLAALSGRVQVAEPEGGKDITEMWRVGVGLRAWAESRTTWRSAPLPLSLRRSRTCLVQGAAP